MGTVRKNSYQKFRHQLLLTSKGNGDDSLLPPLPRSPLALRDLVDLSYLGESILATAVENKVYTRVMNLSQLTIRR